MLQVTLALCGISAVLAGELPYPQLVWKQQRALLVLPPQVLPSNETTPQPDQTVTEKVDIVNENVMEKIRQEVGSDGGVYYIYLPNGNLQKVQYTTAPIKQQENQQAQQPQASTNDYQEEQQLGQYKQTFGQPSSNTPPANQQSNYQVVFGTNKFSNQGNQQQYTRFQPLQQFGESGQQQEYARFQGNQYQSAQQAQLAGNNAESGNPRQILAQFHQDKSQNVPATNYVASVQFTDVPPITGPIFAYNPSPLVRIVRYARHFQ